MKEIDMNALDLLMERNSRFVHDDFPGHMQLRPRLQTMIIGCLDPRVDPSDVFGLQLGDSPVIRNIGGRVTPTVLETLHLLSLGFPGPVALEERGDLIVLHHNDCGILRMQGHPEELAARFGIHPSELAHKHVDDPHRSLAVDVDLLRRQSFIDDAYRVSGIFYEVESGVATVIEP